MQAGLVQLPRLVDEFGAIGVVEGPQALPFDVRRFYFIHSVPPGAVRGSHAHRDLTQLIVALAGSVQVRLDDGHTGTEYSLSEPDVGLLVPPGYWRTLEKFGPGTVVGVLASAEYDESDYIRDYEQFRTWIRVGA